MPTSDSVLISSVLFKVFEKKPKSILDVGVGFGKYGMLCREYGDIGFERYSPTEWKVKIDGIEIFEGYENINWANYNHVYLEDVRKFKFTEKYDVVLLCDVLEHMTKKEAWKLLKKCVKSSKRVIVTTPNGKFSQGTVFGNKHERHLCGFVPSEFKQYSGKAAVFEKVFMVVIDAKK